MKLSVLFSGSKDSAYAIFKALEHGHEISTLVTIKAKSVDSYMYHLPNIHLTEYSALAMGLPLIVEESTGEKELELKELKEVLSTLKNENGIEGVLTGAIASQYQKERVDKICKELSLESIAPLWGMNQLKLLQEMLANKFEIVIVGVSAHGLDESFLGKVIDETVLEKLLLLKEKYQINVAGEGGEIETLVTDCPLFKKKINILESKIEWNGSRGELKIKKVKLTGK